MEKKVLEVEAREILSQYNGSNNQLLEWKLRFEKAIKFNLTRPQAEYVVTNQSVVPKVARKYVDIVDSFGETIMEQRLLATPPTKIWIEKLLCETDKAYHVWGKVFEKDALHAMWLPKFAVVQPEKKYNKIIDFSKYSVRPLLSHQEIAVEKLLANDRYILADDMGLGKSTSAIVASLESEVKKVLIVCPASLKINWKREIEIYTRKKILIIEGTKWGSTFEYYIINYDILKNFHTTETSEDSDAYKLIMNEHFDLAIVDECFTYDSKIMTERGEMNIGDIVEKGIEVKILSYNQITHKLEYNDIVRWIKKNKDTIYQIKLNNGVFIECTDNHKFYTNNRGYVKARELTIDDDLYLLSETVNKETNNEEEQILFEELRINNNEQKQIKENFRKKIPQRMSKLWKNNVFHNTKRDGENKILFNELFQSTFSSKSRNKKKMERFYEKTRYVSENERYSQKQSSIGKNVIRQNEEKQSNVQPNFGRKNEEKINGKNIFIKRRPRATYRTTKITSKIIGKWMESRISSVNKKCKTYVQEFTSRISGRYRERREKNIYRNRRKNAQIKEMEFFRQEKDRSIKFVRMESFKILERGSYDQSSDVHSKNTRVYDLEIENNHNYFINGVLVSNCHMISNTTAQRTKLMNDILEQIPKVWLLTGTPITSRPINYFNLLKLVNSPVTLNWQGYVRRYCGGFQFTVNKRKIWHTGGATHLDELRERTKNIVLRRMKTDVLDLPEKIITPIFLELKNTFYDQELEDFMRITNDKKDQETVPVTLNRLMKIRQLIAVEKIPYTCELIDKFIDQGKKVIVFTNFTLSLQMLQEKYKKSCVILNGQMTKIKKQESVDRFQEDDKVKILIGNIKAAGVGFTMTASEVVIMNDLSFVPSDHSQAEDRAYRYGQKNCVLVYYPVFENTIEMIVYNILQKKKNIIDQVLGDGEYSESFSKELLKDIL